MPISVQDPEPFCTTLRFRGGAYSLTSRLRKEAQRGEKTLRSWVSGSAGQQVSMVGEKVASEVGLRQWSSGNTEETCPDSLG